MNSGKKLESFVKFVEGIALPEGFSVSSNRKVFGEDGDEEAEFDIVIEGDLGTSKFSWLIECRDRPSAGAAPTSWIEQLSGRRNRFNFNKVTAASTTGFARSARTLAKREGIDLRSVKNLSEAEFSEWLQVPTYEHKARFAELIHAEILISDSHDFLIRKAVFDRISSVQDGEKFLISKRESTPHEPKEAYLGLIEQNGLFDKLEKDDEKIPIDIGVNYINSDDCFEIDTSIGRIRIEQIIFKGFIFQETKIVPLVSVRSYSDSSHGTEFSQTAIYEAQDVAGQKMALTLHKDNRTGETQILLTPTKLLE
jgi:hypothetical protein